MLIIVSCGVLFGMFVGFLLLLPDLLVVIAWIMFFINLIYRLLKKAVLFLFGKVSSLF